MLEVGKVYSVTKPSEDWGIIEGKHIAFPEKVIKVVILDKPEEVWVEGEGTQPLPDNLKSSEWYFVRNVDTLRSHWLNSGVHKIEEITGE